jgi:hypothetical protein
MSAPFIALNLADLGSFDGLPIFVNATLIRSVHPRRVRRKNEDGSPMNGPIREIYEIVGTHVSVGDGEEGAFAVAESYGDVTGAIRDALSA